VGSSHTIAGGGSQLTGNPNKGLGAGERPEPSFFGLTSVQKLITFTRKTYTSIFSAQWDIVLPNVSVGINAAGEECTVLTHGSLATCNEAMAHGPTTIASPGPSDTTTPYWVASACEIPDVCSQPRPAVSPPRQKLAPISAGAPLAFETVQPMQPTHDDRTPVSPLPVTTRFQQLRMLFFFGTPLQICMRHYQLAMLF
jgi:hypothetical protein